LTRANRVGQANDNRGETTLTVVGVCEISSTAFDVEYAHLATAGEPKIRSNCSLRGPELFLTYISDELATTTLRVAVSCLKHGGGTLDVCCK
jgi:hypothetical protein